MSKSDRPEKGIASPSRRNLLKAGLAAGGLAATAGFARAAEPDPYNLPPNVADWSRYLGVGVDNAPYGMPSEHESEVVRRSVEWLTASRESSGLRETKAMWHRPLLNSSRSSKRECVGPGQGQC